MKKAGRLFVKVSIFAVYTMSYHYVYGLWSIALHSVLGITLCVITYCTDWSTDCGGTRVYVAKDEDEEVSTYYYQ